MCFDFEVLLFNIERILTHSWATNEGRCTHDFAEKHSSLKIEAFAHVASHSNRTDLTYRFQFFSTISQIQPQDSKKSSKLMMTRSSKWHEHDHHNICILLYSRHFNDRRMGSDVDGEVLGA